MAAAAASSSMRSEIRRPVPSLPMNPESIPNQVSSVASDQQEYKPVKVEGKLFPADFAAVPQPGSHSLNKKLIPKIRMHLVALGWRIECKINSAKRQYIRYISPQGKAFYTLPKACSSMAGTTSSSSQDALFQSQQRQVGIVLHCNRSEYPHLSLPTSLYTACKRYMEEKRQYPSSKTNSKRKASEPQGSNAKRRKENTIPGTLGPRPGKSPSLRIPRSTKVSRRHAKQVTLSENPPKTILNLLIDNDVVLPRVKVFYCHEKGSPAVKEGRVTRRGIKCDCCNQVLSLAEFEAHSGGSTCCSASNIFFQDGRSLLQCQLQLIHSNVPQRSPHARVKADLSSCYTDDICSICQDGGSLLVCDHCPSSFHPVCIGLEDIPQEDWFCHRCRCAGCGSSEFQHDKEQLTEKTILYCDQCEQGYHVGCLGETNSQLTNYPMTEWLCSTKCSTIFHLLQGLVGKRNPTSVKGLSWTLLRSSSGESVGVEIMAEYRSKLHLAVNVLHECFVPIIEPRTRSDFVADLLFNRESELSRLNFRGFYTMVLEKGDEVISVATVRVFGDRIAEMPLIGTRFQHRRKGMCRLLVSELEKLLSTAGVERLLLPAVPQLLSTWTGSFGFSKMMPSDQLGLSQYYSILSFPGTTMCQKAISNA